jgi:hypothetical protein
MPRPLLLLVFIHEDLIEYPYRDLRDHFDWLVSEIEEISGRQMRLTFVPSSDSPEISSYNYKNENSGASLKGWLDQINYYLSHSPIPDFDIKLHKFLLLTREPINSSVLGVAQGGGYGAIASIKRNRTPAHEVGHMFNATHEDGEVLYNGWWSETAMRPFDEFSELRSDADRFSDNNRENIRNYLEFA